MNILVLYAVNSSKVRKTINDSLYCFKAYDLSNNYYYLNIRSQAIIDYLKNYNEEESSFSAVIIHYSAIALRYDCILWNNIKDDFANFVRRLKCYKIIIPQDEYNYTKALNDFIKQAQINAIFTCASEDDYQKLYPKQSGYEFISTVFTGYVTQNEVDEIAQRKTKNSERLIDIGYRARKLPYWLGRHGQLKYELAVHFIDYLNNNETGLISDIENTDGSKCRKNATFFGDDWIGFLLSCRTMLGCLGGSGLLDWDGKLAKEIDEYCHNKPDATFDEVEKLFFEGQDDYIHLYALSPRHFECAMTETCQVLVEGDYAGVFRTGVDYIEIKKDFSNIEEVIEKIKDKEYCEKIARNCYEHVVESGEYSYARFVEKVTAVIPPSNEECEVSPNMKKLCNLSAMMVDMSILKFPYAVSVLGCRGAWPLLRMLLFKTIIWIYRPIRNWYIVRKLHDRYLLSRRQ